MALLAGALLPKGASLVTLLAHLLSRNIFEKSAAGCLGAHWREHGHRLRYALSRNSFEESAAGCFYRKQGGIWRPVKHFLMFCKQIYSSLCNNLPFSLRRMGFLFQKSAFISVFKLPLSPSGVFYTKKHPAKAVKCFVRDKGP